MSKIITPRLLKSWGACSEGYEGFCRLFPEGADLKTATDGLIADGHMSWAEWLFNHARSSGDFAAETAEGFLNTGDQNTGFFNTVKPDDILVFNKPCKRSVWDKADVPSFLRFAITEWVYDDRMTDAEKKANPLFYVAGGYLKKIPYQEAFQEAWRKASVSDRKRVLALPNFDAAVFKDISGIDVEAV